MKVDHFDVWECHLIWHGQMRGGRPHLFPTGNPARVKLGLTNHPDYQIRRDDTVCDEPRCIDPFHYRVILERRFKYDDVPTTPWRDPRDPLAFTDREMAEIADAVQMLLANEIEDEDSGQFEPQVQAEIRRRASGF
ncbi:hypothetical protein NKH57_16795 [Mesorhizobium sp. M1050]|uniref:hypothetical protein n=1 Tax=Mesorhizobium sp. M1050 TaxID=2957051 RepID=UPI0033365BE1